MKLFVFACIIFCSLLSPSTIFAQSTIPTAIATPTPFQNIEIPTTGINLTVSPVFINLRTDPGKTVNSSMLVRNNNNVREHLQVTIAKFSPNAVGQITLADLAPSDAYGKWLAVDEPRFILEPNESKTVDFSIATPLDAALGYYYALVVSRVKTEIGGGNAVVSGSPAVPVLLDVTSDSEKREMQVVDFTTDKAIYEYLPTEFRVQVKNTGNIHVIPFGDVRISSGFSDNDDYLAVIPINEGRGNVLPQSERTFTSSWTEGFITRVPKLDSQGREVKDDKGNTVLTTKWDFSKADKLRFGKYTAHLLFVYDNGEIDMPIDATVSFWVLPWKLMLGAVVFVILVLFGLKSMLSPLFIKRK